MKSPYQDEIKHLRETVIDHVQDVDYLSADEGLDRLSSLYFLEMIFYSRVIDEELNEEIKKSLLEKLMIKMTEWKMAIKFHEKWGEQKTNLGKPCNREYGPEEFYLKLKGAP
jgi:hypothetical protein